MKNTNYYQSGRHKEQVLKARESALRRLKELKIERIVIYNNTPKICKGCKSAISYEKRNNKFCSRSCGATHTNKQRGPRSPETKERISATMAISEKKKAASERQIKKRTKKVCKFCKSIFFVRPCEIGRQYCNTNCHNSDPNRKTAPGGYREGSGRSKHGRYKGIYCGSTYELVWVIYRLDHQLSVDRYPGFISNDTLKYYPDFIDGNTIIEIKGYHTDAVDAKSQLARDKGYDIVVKYRDDLNKEFDWVHKHYRHNKLYLLYDNAVVDER